jgi:D-3-phosphoglycerate dehydrogenase / 2-oxoglutarate reductase
MWKAIVIDKDYGSVSLDHLMHIQSEYAKRGIELVLSHFTTEDEIIKNCKDCDALLGTGNPPVTRKVLEALPKLKVVQRFGIGVNSVDLEAATDTNTIILFMPGFCIDELATHATSLILGLIRNVGFYDRHIRAGEWPKARYFVPKSIDSLTLGLFGFGGSAQVLYEIFKKGFNTRGITYDPYMPDTARKNFDVDFVSFDTLLETSDIISLHAPLNNKTRHIFNKTAFEKMKPESMIVNIARGGLINEEDLVEALRNNTIRFAGLDVFEQEPVDPANPLLKMDNVAVTCHSAFYGEKAQKIQISLAIDLVDSLLNHKKVESRYVANTAVMKKVAGIQFVSGNPKLAATKA